MKRRTGDGANRRASGRMEISRRQFIEATARGAAGALLAGNATALLESTTDDCPHLDEHVFEKVEARYYKKLDDLRLECELCPRKCQVGDTELGFCGVRENCGGVYYTLVYGNPCAVHVDPIEKKPFFHFHPESRAFSIATAGCNVNCKFCQNWQISQGGPRQTINEHLPPAEVVKACRRYRAPIIAYTYSEPIVFFEYMVDTARLGRENGLKSVVVTGGHISPEPLRELIGCVDAIKVDLKAFSEEYYRDVVSGEMKPVLEALRIMAEQGVWTEIVYLVVPGLNDRAGEVRGLCRWLLKNMGPDVPIHFTRFHPQYRLRDLPPTPVSTLTELRELALEMGLNYPYVGNVPGHEGENTYCPGCGKVLVHRQGYAVFVRGIEQGKCGKCGRVIPGRWDSL